MATHGRHPSRRLLRGGGRVVSPTVTLVDDDHALLSLADVAARQGLPAEARQHVILRRAVPLAHVFEQLRVDAEQDEAFAAAHERFDRAQFHLIAALSNRQTEDGPR